MKAAFYPVFDTVADLADHAWRAAWYLAPLARHLDEVSLFAGPGMPTRWADLPPPPETLDSGLPQILAGFAAARLCPAEGIEAALADADVVFLHLSAVRPALEAVLKRLGRAPRIVRVDHRAERYADSFYLRFAETIPGLHDAGRRLATERAPRMLRPLARPRCYLFGTGPNFSLTAAADFSDGLVIACNSMVANPEVLARLRPGLLVIADPIFHAGPSSYAEAFRASLVAAMAAHDCPLVVPLRDYHIYFRHLPAAVHERLLPIDFVPGAAPNLDLIAAPQVTTTSNILTLFQIPLAATLAPRIAIAGCDGRPLSHNDYFWSHDPKVQINDRMAQIRAAHPAFFDISYDDYYTSHIDTLARWVGACEAAGHEVVSLTPSHIPALQSRQVPELLPVVLPGRPVVRVSVVIPCHDCAEWLGQTVASLLAEGRDDLEILLVDDFSEDATPQVARELAERHPCVHLVQNFGAKGVSGARNTGIALARGEYLGFLDADDVILPGSLNARVARLDAEPETVMVHGQVEFIGPDGESLGLRAGTPRNVTFADLGSGNPTILNTVLLRRSVAELHFDEGLVNGEDWLALARLLRLGHVSVFEPAGAATYRVHGKSTVLRDMAGHESRLLPVLDWIFGTVGPDEASARFRAGPGIGSLDEVKVARRFSPLVFALLQGDAAQLGMMLDDPALAGWLEQHAEGLEQRMRVPAIRALRRKVTDLPALATDERRQLFQTLDAVAARRGAAPLRAAVMRLFGPPSAASAAGVAATAPPPRAVLPPAAAAFLLREGGEYLPLPLAAAAARLPDLVAEGAGAPAALLVWDDPQDMLARAIAAGEDAGAALAGWLRELRMHLVLARTAGPACGFVARGRLAEGIAAAPGLGLPAVPPRPAPDPLDAAVAALLVAQDPEAARLLAELESGTDPDRLPLRPTPAAAEAALTALRRAAAGVKSAAKVAVKPETKPEAGAEAALALAKEQVVQLQATLEASWRDAEALRAELGRIYASKSWRVTEPLRGVRRRLGGAG